MRGCVSKAGDKLSPTIRRTLTSSLLQLITSSEDVTRGCAAGCLASLLPSLPDEELDPVLAEAVLAEVDLHEVDFPLTLPLRLLESINNFNFADVSVSTCFFFKAKSRFRPRGGSTNKNQKRPRDRGTKG